MVWGALIGAGVSLIGSMMSKGSADDAAAYQAQKDAEIKRAQAQAAIAEGEAADKAMIDAAAASGRTAEQVAKINAAADKTRADAEALEIRAGETKDAAEAEALRVEAQALRDANQALKHGKDTSAEALSTAEEGADRARELAAQAATTETATAAEQARIVGREHEYKQSLARAKAGASGVDATGKGTTTVYERALKEAGKQEVDWIHLVGRSKAERQLAVGENQAATIMASGKALSMSSINRAEEAYSVLKEGGKSQKYQLLTQGESVYAQALQSAQSMFQSAFSLDTSAFSMTEASLSGVINAQNQFNAAQAAMKIYPLQPKAPVYTPGPIAPSVGRDGYTGLNKEFGGGYAPDGRWLGGR